MVKPPESVVIVSTVQTYPGSVWIFNPQLRFRHLQARYRRRIIFQIAPSDVLCLTVGRRDISKPRRTSCPIRTINRQSRSNFIVDASDSLTKPTMSNDLGKSLFAIVVGFKLRSRLVEYDYFSHVTVRGPPSAPVCSWVTLSPYFLGAIRAISHLRASTRSRDRLITS